MKKQVLDMNRQEATQKILAAKIKKGLTWEEIAKISEHSETWVVTALLGQATMTRPEAEKIGKLLELDEEVVQALTVVPLRGTSNGNASYGPDCISFI